MSRQQNPQDLDYPCGSHSYFTTHTSLVSEEYNQMHLSPTLVQIDMTMIGGNSPLYDSQYRPEYEQLNVNTQGSQVDGNIYRSYSASPSSQSSYSMFSPNLPPIQYVVRKDPSTIKKFDIL